MSEAGGFDTPAGITSPRSRLLERIEEEILTATDPEAPSPPPLLVLEAPRGMGKTRLVRRLADRLLGRGRFPFVIDIGRVGLGSIALARHLPATIGSSTGFPGRACPRAAHVSRTIEEELSRARPHAGLLLELSFSYAESLAQDLSTPLVGLFDEMGEITRLARHPGLRDALGIVARAMASAVHVTPLMTIAPASRAGPLLACLEEQTPVTGRRLVRLTLPPLEEADLPGGIDVADRSALLAVTAGRPLYAAPLIARLEEGTTLETALLIEISPTAGLLHQECRFEYHLLVERCRGDAVVRNLLEFLSRNGGAGLTAIAKHLRITPPAALDYLSWMLEVELLARQGRGYHLADPMLGLWITVNGPSRIEPAIAVRDLLAGCAQEIPGKPPARIRGPRPPARPPAESPSTPDSLMEID